MYKSQHRNASRVAVNVCTRLYHMETNKKIKVTVLGDKSFVATKLCLSTQIFVATKYVFCRVCCDKTFVATKMILVAAPANDISPSPHPSCQFLFGDNSAYDKLSISSPANHKNDGDSGGKEAGFSRPISEAIQA